MLFIEEEESYLSKPIWVPLLVMQYDPARRGKDVRGMAFMGGNVFRIQAHDLK